MTRELTLRLSCIEGYREAEVRSITVTLPEDATEEDLRRAFHHVESLVHIEGRDVLDAAVLLVTSIIESREVVADTNTETVTSPSFEGTVTMDDQRKEVAAKQASDPLGTQSAATQSP